MSFKRYKTECKLIQENQNGNKMNCKKKRNRNNKYVVKTKYYLLSFPLSVRIEFETRNIEGNQNTVKLTRAAAAGHTYRRKILLTSSLSPDSDCNSISSAGIYFSHIIYLQFRQYCLFYCKDARTLKTFI